MIEEYAPNPVRLFMEGLKLGPAVRVEGRRELVAPNGAVIGEDEYYTAAAVGLITPRGFDYWTHCDGMDKPVLWDVDAAVAEGQWRYMRQQITIHEQDLIRQAERHERPSCRWTQYWLGTGFACVVLFLTALRDLLSGAWEILGRALRRKVQRRPYEYAVMRAGRLVYVRRPEDRQGALWRCRCGHQERRFERCAVRWCGRCGRRVERVGTAAEGAMRYGIDYGNLTAFERRVMQARGAGR